MKEKLNINEMIKSADETFGVVKTKTCFTKEESGENPSRCATVIAARHQSGTHSLSTETIQRRVDQIITVLQQY